DLRVVLVDEGGEVTLGQLVVLRGERPVAAAAGDRLGLEDLPLAVVLVALELQVDLVRTRVRINGAGERGGLGADLRIVRWRLDHRLRRRRRVDEEPAVRRIPLLPREIRLVGDRA